MRTTAIYPFNNNIHKIDVYGYKNRGVPGLEILIEGKTNRFLREKIIYLSKLFKMDIPLGHYTICLEFLDKNHTKKIDKIKFWLELPLIIFFWSLASCIKLNNLESCFISGSMNSKGQISFPEIPLLIIKKINEKLIAEKRSIVWIGDYRKEWMNLEMIKQIDIKDILNR